RKGHGRHSSRQQQAPPRNRLDAELYFGTNLGRHAGLLERAAMRIAVIGTGYVGLVTSTCLAESGNTVIGIDKDAAKIETLKSGKLPIYEPGLLELVQRNRREERLAFTTDLKQGIQQAQLVFIAVGTPQSADGAADLSALWAVS